MFLYFCSAHCLGEGSGFSLSCGQVLALVKVVRRDMRGCAGGVEGGLGSGICRWRDRGLIYLWD